MLKIRDALTELANEVKKEILRRMASDIGINKRTGTNTLVGSGLYYSVDVYPRSDTTLIFQIANYYQWVVTGWYRTKKGPGTFQEYLFSIRDWIRRKHIRWQKHTKHGMVDLTENEMMWALAKAMFNPKKPYSIAPRPFINYDPEGDLEVILPFLEKFFEDWADNVFEKIMEETDKFFNS